MATSLTNWIYRAGYRLLVCWVPATGESLSTPIAKPVAFAHAEERRTLASGRLARVSRERSVAPELTREADLRTLRAWDADGADIRALLVSRGRGRHYQWEEAVPCLTEPFDALPGALAGDRLYLHSSKFSAAVYEDNDLLAPLSFASGGDWGGFADGAFSVTWGVDADGNATATLEAEPGTTLALYADLALPAPGLAVAFAARFGALPAAADAAVRMTVVDLAYGEHADGAEGGTPVGYGEEAATPTEEVLSPGDAEAAEEVAHTLGPTAYAVRVAVEIAADAGAAGAQAVTVALPALLTRGLDGHRVEAAQWGIKAFEAGGPPAKRYLLTYGPASQATTTNAEGWETMTVTAPAGFYAAVPDAETGLDTITVNTDD